MIDVFEPVVRNGARVSCGVNYTGFHLLMETKVPDPSSEGEDDWSTVFDYHLELGSQPDSAKFSAINICEGFQHMEGAKGRQKALWAGKVQFVFGWRNGENVDLPYQLTTNSADGRTVKTTAFPLRAVELNSLVEGLANFFDFSLEELAQS